MPVYSALFQSPIGPLALEASETALVWVGFDGRFRHSERLGPNHITRQAEKQLGEYFAGRRQAFDLPLDLAGTPFQQAVWQALQRLPFGATITYSRLAELVGRPAAVRAVGQANGANPIPVIVP